MLAYDKRDFDEVKQVECSIAWKQSVRSAARRRRKERKKDLKHYIEKKKKNDWCKPNPALDNDEPSGTGALLPSASMHWLFLIVETPPLRFHVIT